eukprot:830564-Prymnesium_polylepis.2
MPRAWAAGPVAGRPLRNLSCAASCSCLVRGLGHARCCPCQRLDCALDTPITKSTRRHMHTPAHTRTRTCGRAPTLYVAALNEHSHSVEAARLRQNRIAAIEGAVCHQTAVGHGLLNELGGKGGNQRDQGLEPEVPRDRSGCRVQRARDHKPVLARIVKHKLVGVLVSRAEVEIEQNEVDGGPVVVVCANVAGRVFNTARVRIYIHV